MIRNLLAQLSEGFSLAALFSMVLPLAFPIVAWIDGAGDGYYGLSIVYLGFAVVASVLVFGACVALSELCDSLSRPDLDASYNEAYRAYLLNGGRV